MLILQVQLVPQEFVTGMQTKHLSCSFFFGKVSNLMILEIELAIFSCMPTALSSGVALTQVLHELIFLLYFSSLSNCAFIKYYAICLKRVNLA